jgi:hypothetical protein
LQIKRDKSELNNLKNIIKKTFSKSTQRKRCKRCNPCVFSSQSK